MRHLSGVVLAVSMLCSANAANAGLELLWELDGLKEPESVVLDPANDVLYVSVMEGAPDQKDGKGYIAKVGTDGKMQQQDWVTGLNAPKGMAIHNNRLYVSDIDALVEIDIASGKVLNRFEDSAAKFMNDVAAGADGSIYVSDMMTNRIYRLRGGSFEVWLENPTLLSPNGLHVEDKRLVVGSMGTFGEKPVPGDLLAVSLTDKSVSILSDRVGHLDGVEADGKGGYYLTDWPGGKILHLVPGKEAETLLTRAMGTADLDVALDSKRLYVPLMQEGKLAAYSLP